MEPEPYAEMSPPSSSRVAAAARPQPLTPVRFYVLDDEEYDDEWPAYPLSPGGEPHPPCPRPQRPPLMSPRAWKAAAAAAAAEAPAAAFQLQEPLSPGDFDFPPYEPEPEPLLPADLEYQEMIRAKAAADALHHYNADPRNEVKYEATRVTGFTTIFNSRAGYRHVNFFARAKQPREDGATTGEEAQERFFFAEVRYKERGPWIPTCLCSLDAEGDDQVGGVGDEPFTQAKPWLVPVDYCLVCGDEIKHPKDGESYVAGHVYALPQKIPGSD